nr:hypothetical protein MIMGU_mgv1a024924mg [Ipomoea batatas]GME02431.1 hypothetical protein MIMGU_mgv1a024924mg [Ipomoea batatas]
MAAGETTLAVIKDGEDTGPAAHCGGGFLCKAFRKGKNVVLNFINSGGSRHVGPPRTDISGSDDEGSRPEKPIIAAMEKQELGKAVFMLAVPMSTAIMFVKADTVSPAAVRFTLVANAVGIAAIWNGILLRKRWPRIASFAEQVGMSSVFLGFHMLVANYLSPELRFFPAICLGFSVLPFLVAAIPGGGKDHHGAKQDVCPDPV